MKRKFSKRTIFGAAITIIYVFATLLASIKFQFQKLDSYSTLGIPGIFFVSGLAIYLAPAEIFLRINPLQRYFLYKTSPDEKEALGCASTYYTVLGLALMLFPTMLSLAALFLM
jgi:hypothetical protein